MWVWACHGISSGQLIVGYDFNGADVINTSGVIPDLAPGTINAFPDPVANGLLRPGAVVVAGVGPDGSDALQVNGNGYGAWTPYAPKFDYIAGTSNVTMAYWIKTPDNANAWQGTVAYGGLTGGPRMFNQWGIGALGAIQLDNGDGWNPINMGPGPENNDPGVWHHVAMVLDNGLLYGYYDGVQYGPVVRSGSSVLSHPDQPFTIGGFTDDAGNDGGNTITAGTMFDDAAYWKGAATPQIILDLYIGSERLSDFWCVETLPPLLVIEPNTNPFEVIENHSGASYTIELEVPPSGDVIVTVDPNGPPEYNGADLDLGAGPGVPVILTFSDPFPQTVEVAAVDNDVLEGDRAATIVNRASSSTDSNYHGKTAKISVTIRDNECGHWGYAPMDFNEDCWVNVVDFAIFVQFWLECSLPYEAGCSIIP